MRILAVTPVVPWPLDCGGRIRTFELLRRAARDVELELWCVRQPGIEESVVDRLADRGLRVRTFERSALPHHHRFVRTKPERWFSSRELADELRVTIRTGPFDVVHLDDVVLARVLSAADLQSACCALVCHHHKLEPDVAAPLARTPREHHEVRRLRALEQTALGRFERHVVCTHEDRRRLVERYGPRPCHVVPNGFDPRRFHPVRSVERGADRLLFLGSLTYAPNVDAVRRLTRTILPLVRRARPETHLDVVGSSPSEDVRALAGRDVRVFGSVPDPLPHLASATVMAVPLVAGTGSRLKVVEALASECPLVASTIGAEGFDLEPGHHLLTADDDRGFASALVRALEEPLATRARARRGHEHVTRNFTWDRVARALLAAWDEAARADSRGRPRVLSPRLAPDY